jgi:hypothetical protein
MRRALLTTIVVLATAAACARQGPRAAAPEAAFAQRARAVADAWHAAVTGPAGATWRTGLVALEELTVPPAQELTDDLRVALASGWFRTRTPLPSTTPLPVTVTFPDGATTRAPLVSARAAYAELDRGDPPCRQPLPLPPASSTPAPAGTTADGSVGAPASHTCAELTVTGATLGTTRLRTSRGVLVVPAWLFSVAELPAPLARAALAAAALSPLPQASVAPWADQPSPLAAAMKLTAADDTTLTYTIGVGACDRDPTGLVYETDDAVVIGGRVQPATGGPCVGALALQPVSVTLTRPLGARAVLSAASGQPLLRTVSGP